MGKKVAHKHTRMIIDSADNKGSPDDYTPNWKGRINILAPEKSVIAKKIGVDQKGEYAIKVR